MSKFIDTVFNRYIPPESIRVESKDIRKDITANPEVLRKIAEIAGEIEVTFKALKQGMIAEMLFILLIVVGVWTQVVAVMFASLMMFVWLRGRNINLEHTIKQRMGFVDGIIYTLNDVSKVVEKASKDPDFVKRFEQDMNDLKANLVEDKV